MLQIYPVCAKNESYRQNLRTYYLAIVFFKNSIFMPAKSIFLSILTKSFHFPPRFFFLKMAW